MTVPVILLNYNSSQDCAECCQDLTKQTGVGIEIIIVDNKSKAEDLQAVKSLCQSNGYTLITADVNRGYNAGNNLGLRYAADKGYKYALIANPDMRFTQPDYIKRLTDAFEDDPNVVVAATDIIGLDGKHQNPMSRDTGWKGCFNWVGDLLHIRGKSDTYDFIDRYDVTHNCSKVSGCCLMVRLSFMQQVGYFDENVFLYCEEAILSRQVEDAGKKMVYLSNSQAVHAHRKSAKGDPAPRFRRWRDSRIYYIRKYSGYSAIGKFMSILSMRLYCMTFVTLSKLRK